MNHTYTVVTCNGKGTWNITKVSAGSAKAAIADQCGRRMTEDELNNRPRK